MSRSKRKMVRWFGNKAGTRKKHKRLTHKLARTRVRDAINKGEYEKLYDVYCGKQNSLDYFIYEYDIYSSEEVFRKNGFDEETIKRIFSK